VSCAILQTFSIQCYNCLSEALLLEQAWEGRSTFYSLASTTQERTQERERTGGFEGMVRSSKPGALLQEGCMEEAKLSWASTMGHSYEGVAPKGRDRRARESQGL
jgi:hypothetical protein